MESAFFEFVPKDTEMTYVTACLRKTVCDELGGDEEIYAEWVSNLWSIASDYGMRVNDYLKAYALTTGNNSYYVQKLMPDTQYMVMAVGMSADTEQLSEIVKAEFSTLPVEMNGATFDIAYDFNGSSVTMNIQPSSNEIYYYYAPLKKSDLEHMSMTLEESLKSYFDEQIAYGSMFGISREEVMSDLLYQGAASTEYANLHASSDYLGTAVSVSLQGYLCSELTVSEFVTPPGEQSDNILALKVSDVGVDRFFLEITATNDDPYCMLVIPTEQYPGLSPQGCMEKLEGNHLLDDHMSNGNKSGIFKGLTPETEYYVMLFGYKNGIATTELQAETIRTSKEGNPEELQIKVEFSDITSNSLTYTIKPSPDNVLYFNTIVPADYSKQTVYDYIDYLTESYIHYGMVIDREDFLKKVSVYGEQMVPSSNLIAGYKYKVCAIGVYPHNGKFATDVLFSQTVRTEDRETSDVRIVLDGSKYFDGDEVVRKYPQYTSGKGKAVVPVKVETEGDVECYYYHLYYNDLSDPEKDPDDALIKALVTQGGLTTPETIFYAEFNRTVTLVGVAKDRNRVCGKVFRYAFTPSPDGCSPVEEFVPLSEDTPANMMQKQWGRMGRNIELRKDILSGNGQFFTYDKCITDELYKVLYVEDVSETSIWPRADLKAKKSVEIQTDGLSL